MYSAECFEWRRLHTIFFIVQAKCFQCRRLHISIFMYSAECFECPRLHKIYFYVQHIMFWMPPPPYNLFLCSAQIAFNVVASTYLFLCTAQNLLNAATFIQSFVMFSTKWLECRHLHTIYFNVQHRMIWMLPPSYNLIYVQRRMFWMPQHSYNLFLCPAQNVLNAAAFIQYIFMYSAECFECRRLHTIHFYVQHRMIWMPPPLYNID